jgi:hypothetical protein
MAVDRPGVVHIPWYATLFRGDKFALALQEISPIAARYGGTDWAVHRSRDDHYKFLHMFGFPDKAHWEQFWNGPEFSEWRAEYSSWYQVPVLYVWQDVVIAGHVGHRTEVIA